MSLNEEDRRIIVELELEKADIQDCARLVIHRKSKALHC